MFTLLNLLPKCLIRPMPFAMGYSRETISVVFLILEILVTTHKQAKETENGIYGLGLVSPSQLVPASIPISIPKSRVYHPGWQPDSASDPMTMPIAATTLWVQN